MRTPVFRDRADAGQRLAEAILERGAPADPVVLALPRGGVPVAVEIANRLQAPLDLIFVRKIGAPGYPEYGIGALVDGSPPQMVLNQDFARTSGATAAYLEGEVGRQMAEVSRQRQAYLGDRAPLPTVGRNVIVVDDGIATGGSVKAAIKALRASGAASILLAVPVGPEDVIDALERETDALVCLYSRPDFRAVSVYYDLFPQTSDEEVVALLAVPPTLKSG